MIQEQHSSLQPPAIPRRSVTLGALLPKQSAANGPPALARLQVARLPVGIVGEYGKARINVQCRIGARFCPGRRE